MEFGFGMEFTISYFQLKLGALCSKESRFANTDNNFFETPLQNLTFEVVFSSIVCVENARTIILTQYT